VIVVERAAGLAVMIHIFGIAFAFSFISPKHALGVSVLFRRLLPRFRDGDSQDRDDQNLEKGLHVETLHASIANYT
jgi:hypothetical protein